MIDADGLNAFAGQLAADRARRGAPTILTPHAGELGRLLGSLRGGDRRPPPRRRPARRREAAGAVVVLKGDDTIVTDGERVAVNALSAPALATAGTGDVLSGIIGGAARPRPRALRRRLRRGPRPRPRRPRRGRARIGAAESVIATDVIDSIPVGHCVPTPSGRITSRRDEDRRRDHGRRRADRLARGRCARRDRAARQDRHGRDPGRRRGPQGGRHRQRVGPDPQRRGVRPAPAALPQHHGRDRLRRLDEGLRGAARQGLRDQSLRADDRRPGGRPRPTTPPSASPGRSPRRTTTTCPWSTPTAASPGWSRGPTRWPRSSPTSSRWRGRSPGSTSAPSSATARG